jgi:hypothetical protein
MSKAVHMTYDLVHYGIEAKTLVFPGLITRRKYKVYNGARSS